MIEYKSSSFDLSPYNGWPNLKYLDVAIEDYVFQEIKYYIDNSYIGLTGVFHDIERIDKSHLRIYTGATSNEYLEIYVHVEDNCYFSIYTSYSNKLMSVLYRYARELKCLETGLWKIQKTLYGNPV